MKFYSLLPKNVSIFWTGADQKRVFDRNKKYKSKDWIYRTKKIVYNYNEYGFREKPFAEIDWSESVVIFGCSNVEGVGLAEEDTLPKQLEKIIDRPVVNLGVGGSGIDIACWNSLTLHDYLPKPKALIQIWSSLDRYSDVSSNYVNYVKTYMPGPEYYMGLDWAFRARQYIKADRALWRDKIPYIEGTFFHYYEHEKEDLKIHEYQTEDHARDLLHHGIESNRIAAEDLAKKLKQLI